MEKRIDAPECIRFVGLEPASIASAGPPADCVERGGLATLESGVPENKKPRSAIVLRNAKTLEKIRVWTPGSDIPEKKQTNDGAQTITGRLVILSADSKKLAWSYEGLGNGVEMVDIASNRIESRISLPQTASAIDLSPDGRVLGTRFPDTTASLWDIAVFPAK